MPRLARPIGTGQAKWQLSENIETRQRGEGCANMHGWLRECGAREQMVLPEWHFRSS